MSYSLGKKIGSGSFGSIYQGVHIKTGKLVAIKKEPLKAKHPQVAYEARIYKILAGGRGVPQVYDCYTDDTHTVMTMDLLGPSLEDMFRKCGYRFSLKTVTATAHQILQRLEYVHSRHIIHRDVKPENFLVGPENTIYIIDFGLSKRFQHAQTLKHIPYKENKNLTGTARYASLYTQLGIEQSRRDDLEALGYMLIYFVNGKLPWQGLQGHTKKEKYDRICDKKMAITTGNLCRGLPVEFTSYFNYVKTLRFTDMPDYSYLRSLFPPSDLVFT